MHLSVAEINATNSGNNFLDSSNNLWKIVNYVMINYSIIFEQFI